MRFWGGCWDFGVVRFWGVEALRFRVWGVEVAGSGFWCVLGFNSCLGFLGRWGGGGGGVFGCWGLGPLGFGALSCSLGWALWVQALGRWDVQGAFYP